MIVLNDMANVNQIGNLLIELRQAIERMAARHGHPDPGDFVGSLSFELCTRGPLPAYRCTPGHIFSLAKKRLYDHYRRRGSFPVTTTLDGTETHKPPETEPNVDSVQSQTLAAQAIAELTPRQRDILVRKYVLKQPDGEIAAVHHLSRNGVRSAVHRGKKLLIEYLFPDGGRNMDDAKLTETYRRFSESHDCFLDGILCDPALREPFLEELQSDLGDEPEADLLGRLVTLRKRGDLARRKPR